MPYVVAPGAIYDLAAFTTYYVQVGDGSTAGLAAGAWGVFGSQVDFSGPVLLQGGYPTQQAAQVALEQMLGADLPVRQFPAP